MGTKTTADLEALSGCPRPPGLATSGRVRCASRRLESIQRLVEHPARSTNVGADRSKTFHQFSVGRDHHHARVGVGDGDESVVALARRVNDLHGSASDSAAPSRARPSNTRTTGGSNRAWRTVARTCSAKRRAAAGRSRHHPVGRDPITLAASRTSIRYSLASRNTGYSRYAMVGR